MPRSVDVDRRDKARQPSPTLTMSQMERKKNKQRKEARANLQFPVRFLAFFVR